MTAIVTRLMLVAVRPLVVATGTALSAALFAGLAGSAPRGTEAPEISQRASACARYVVIDSRGSGEQPSISAPGSVFYPWFKTYVQRRDPAATTALVPNGYPAWGSLPTLLSALVKLPQRYHKSVVEGKEWLTETLINMTASCPGRKFVLVGYSQGAQVTGDVYQSWTVQNILGVVLFGDPKFNSADPAARGGEPGLDGALGTRPLFRVKPGPWSAGHVLSYCHSKDPVCQGVSRLRHGSSAHKYHETGEPEQAARYLAQLVPKAEPPPAALTFDLLHELPRTPGLFSAVAEATDGTIWVLAADEPGYVYHLIAFGLDGTKRVYRLDQRWRGAGKRPRAIRFGAGAPQMLAVSRNAVWYLNPVAGTFGRLINGVRREFPLPFRWRGYLFRAPPRPAAITTAPRGNDAWLLGEEDWSERRNGLPFGNGSDTAVRVSPSGQVTKTIRFVHAPPKGQDAWPRLGGAEAILALPDGRLWLAGVSAIGSVSPSGGKRVLRTFLPTKRDPNAGAVALAHGPSGVWFAEAWSRGGRGAVGRLGQGITRFAMPSKFGPVSIAITADGAAWFVGETAMLGRASTAGSISFVPLPDGAGRAHRIVRGRNDSLIMLTEVELGDHRRATRIYRVTIAP